MDDQLNQSTPINSDDQQQGSGDQSREDRENDARAFIAIADALDEQADDIEKIVAETSEQYQQDVAEDVETINNAVQELESISHEADMDDAKQQIDEA
jgi:uncharacterized protein YpuA (DUF1002 family)